MKNGRTYDRRTDGQTDGRTNGQTDGLTDDLRETIIPHHYCVVGYKKRNKLTTDIPKIISEPA